MSAASASRFQAPIAAGIAFAAFGIFGTLPVLLGLAVALGLDQAATTSWIFAVSMGAGLATIPLVLAYREPYSIGWNLPAAVLLGAAGVRYPWPTLLGASAVAGVAIVVGSFVGLGGASLRLLPFPLVMAMFAGSILRLLTDAFAQLGTDPAIGGAAIGGYFATRLAFRDRVPAALGALVASLAATALLGKFPGDIPFVLSGPTFALPRFEIGAMTTLVVPLVLLVVGTGNVQAIGFLRGQGYRPPTERLTFTVGALTALNALFGASPSGMARVGAAIVGGPDPGPAERRWIASLIASVAFIAVAILAVPVASLALALPRALVTTVAGLAIANSLLEALRTVFTSDLLYSSFFALIIAFSPFAPLGLEAAFWSLVAGLVLAFLFERPALFAALRHTGDEEPRRAG